MNVHHKLKRATDISRFIRALPMLALLTGPTAQAQGTSVVTLAFEHDGLDLDTGTVTPLAIHGENAGADIRVAFNALRSPSAVVMAAVPDGVDIAFLPGVPFDGVGAETAAGVAFATDPVDVPFSASDTVLVRTEEGTLFKLGNASESAAGVTLNYSAL
jgi:hypothetical protein